MSLTIIDGLNGLVTQNHTHNAHNKTEQNIGLSENAHDIDVFEMMVSTDVTHTENRLEVQLNPNPTGNPSTLLVLKTVYGPPVHIHSGS